MDSLTQIVLGAAVGEAVLGKKIGNRAMVWGAVGGTIPDLDVIGKFFLSTIDNVAFHRGISHSICFSIIGAIAIGWLVHQLYKSQYHKWIAVFFRLIAAVLVASAIDFVIGRFFPGNYFPISIVVLGLAFFLYSNSKKRYFSGRWEAPEASLRDWQWLFFWSLITHPILDCFTIYGTQLFAPFSDMRISWGTIAVADPIYTFPFLICLLVAARFNRTSNRRRYWNYAGIAWSSLYLLFTVFNKQRVNNIFAAAMADQQIPVERFVSNPSILNNIVWNCTAETANNFYVAQYSLFDEVDVAFSKIEKNHHLLNNLDSDKTIKTLRWFSDDFYTISPIGQQHQFNDLRFGTFSGKGSGPDDFIFRFILSDQGPDGYYLEETLGGPPQGKEQEIMGKLWQRIGGLKK